MHSIDPNYHKVSDLIDNRSDLIDNRSDLIDNRSDLIDNRSDLIDNRSDLIDNRSDLSNLNTAKTFSVFHVNIRSLTKHFSELHSLTNSTKIPFDTTGITESKQTIGMDVSFNVNMDGYNIHTQPTKS